MKYKIDTVVDIQENDKIKISYVVKKRIFLLFWKVVSPYYQHPQDAEKECKRLNK